MLWPPRVSISTAAASCSTIPSAPSANTPSRVRLHADVVARFTVKIVSEDKAHLVEEEAAEAPAEAPTEEAAE